MKRLKHIFFLVAWVQVLFAYSQSISAPQVDRGFSLQHYTDENGLPQNSVTQIAFDNAGYLWFSTNGGLVRFDGHTFMVLEKSHLGFSDPAIQHLLLDQHSKVLFAISRSGNLGLISRGKFILLKHTKVSDKNYKPGSSTLPYLYGRVIPYAFNGKYYSYIIPGKESAYYSLSGDTLTMLHHNERKYTTKVSQADIEPWRLFVVENKLYHIDQRGNIKHYGEKIKNITPKGDLPKNKSYGRSGNEIRSLINATTGDAFVYLENSLYLLSEDTAGLLTTKLILTGFDFSDHAISTICFDKEHGRIFLGSYTDGLFVFTGKQFTALSLDDMVGGSTVNSYNALIPYGRDRLLTSEGSIFGINGVEGYLDEFSRLSDHNSLLRDREGNVWSKRVSNLFLWDKEAKKNQKNWNVNRIISVIFSGIDSTIWIGTKTPGGLYSLNIHDENPQPKRVAPSLPNVTFISQNKPGNLLLGTVSGLYTLDQKSGKINAIKQFKNNVIRGMYTDTSNNGNVWVIVEDGGIYLYRNGEVSHMPNDKEGFMNDPRCILRDSLGNFWITTGKGLFKVAEQDFLNYADKKNGHVYYYYYGKSSGFNTNEFSGFCEPCGVQLESGYIAFPTLNGLVWFNPAHPYQDHPDDAIHIDRIDVDGKNLALDSNSYQLTRRFKKLSIYYSTPYFGSRNNIYFESRLDDEPWQRNISNPIVFTSLPSGTHQLYIRKISGTGIGNYSEVIIEFDVPLAYWQTWWFVVLCVIGSFLVIYSYTKLRVIYIKRKNDFLEENIAERTQELKQTIHALKESKEIISRDAELQKRLTASIAHDVKTPLKYLLLTADSLSKTSPEQLSKEHETIKTIHLSLYRIYHFTDNLLAYIKSGFNSSDAFSGEAVNIKKLIQEKIDIFNDIAKKQSTVIENNVSDNIDSYCNKNLLSVIIHNLIDNAVKFTFNGKISIKATAIEGGIQITIKDTGVGIHPEQMESIQLFFESEDLKWTPGYNKHNGLGLVIIKEIIKQLGGNIFIDSEKDIGTMIVLNLSK